MSPDSCQRIVDNLSTAVLVFDAELVLRALNPAGETLFEISAKKVLGQPLLRMLPRGRRLARALRHAVRTGHPFTERGLVLPLGIGERAISVDCTVNVLDAGGAAPQLLVELSQVDRLLRMARDETRHDTQLANRAVIRGLAHEIKNPLGGLRGAAQLLERELNDRALREYTRIIIHEADRLRNLVDRMIGPNRPLKRAPVNIHQIFERVRSLMLAEVPEGVLVVRDYDPSLPECEGDSEQLIQAVLNIVRNAVQAMGHQGRLVLRSRVERQWTNGQTRYRLALRADIEDDGPGIPEALMEHIFYPMVTGRPDGMGLGLSIAHTIVSQHAGALLCQSRPGKTVFSIYLPLEQAHAEG